MSHGSGRVAKLVLIGVNILLVFGILRCVLTDTLHRDCVLGNKDRVAELLAAGADVHERVNGELPLHLDVQEGHPVIVRMLVAAGADVNLRSGYWGDTPLERAEYWNRPEIARYLREQGAVQ